MSLISFLIDEDLSPELAKVAKARGYLALSVQKLVKLRGRGDGVITKYDLDKDMILVTRNMIDFEALYADRPIHPGIVFFKVEHGKLNELKYQRAMMELAIDDIIESEPIQQALLVLASGKPGRAKLTVDRYYLPDLEPRQDRAPAD